VLDKPIELDDLRKRVFRRGGAVDAPAQGAGADDDPDLRGWLRTVLRHYGMEVLEAESGVELLERLSGAGPFDWWSPT
jgi:hypothetical protein